MKGRRFECVECGKTFAWRKDLHRHENTHFGTPKFSCDYCDRKFLRRDKRNDHMKSHLKDTLSKSNRQSSAWNFAEHLYTAQRFSLVQCKLCEGRFTTTRALLEHLKEHESLSTLEHLKLDSSIVQQLHPNKELTLEELRKDICKDIAEQIYSKYYVLVNEHGYEMCLSDSDGGDDDNNATTTKYTCELCSETFARKYQVLEHSKSQHANDKFPYKCKVCKMEFVTAPIYESHIRTQCRNKERKYKCLKCPGKFMWEENLLEHNCSYRIRSEENSANHELNLIPELEEKSEVKSKRELRSKSKTEKCSTCGISVMRWHMKRHMRTHKEIVPADESVKRCIECCLCGKECERLADLRIHLQTHADGVTDINIEMSRFYKEYVPEETETQPLQVEDRIAADFVKQDLALYYSAIDVDGKELDLQDSESDFESDADREESKPTYQCAVCQSVYKRRKQLLHHQEHEHVDLVTTSSLPFSCEICQKGFVCAALLVQHKERVCENSHRKHECNKCEEKFVWQENLQLHTQLRHSERNEDSKQEGKLVASRLHCEVCGKGFIWPKDLTRHMRAHLPDEEKFECPFCGRKFNRKDNMKSHLKIHGDAAVESVFKKSKLNDSPTKYKAVDSNLCKPHGCKLIQCMVCNSKHSKISDLRSHLKTHTFDSKVQPYDGLYSITNEVGYELNINSSETDSDIEFGETNSVDEGSLLQNEYTCELCQKSFKRKYKIFDHQLKQHTWEEVPFMCTLCNARFLSQSLLVHHQENQCKNFQKRFICKKCPLRFMWKENFKIHLRTMHGVEDENKKLPPFSFECKQCNRSFQMQKDLTRHMVMHRSDAAMFKCWWCPRKFYRTENLYMHIKRHGITPETLPTAKCILNATSGPNGPKKVICKICNIVFSSVIALREHLMQQCSSADDGMTVPHYEFNSPLNYSITNQSGFELQLDDSETDDDTGGGINMQRMQNRYTCAICNLSTKRKLELVKHQLAMHKPEQIPYKCDKCVFRSVSLDILNHHMRTQCHNEQKQHKCEICGFRFMWQENLESHLLIQHPPEETNEATTTAPDEIPATASTSTKSPTKSTTGQIFQCDQCDCKYNRKDRLSAHLKKMHQPNSKIKIKKEKEDITTQLDPVTGEFVKKAPLEKKYLCSFCGRALTSSSNLIIHMRRHTGEKPFKCDFCDMAFPRSSDLQCHRRTHTGEKPHKCTVCNKAFSRSYKMQTHMRIHSGERPYKCTYCEKSFTQSNDLTLHIRRHTGERPYICGICGERFIQGTALKNHRTMRGHFEDVQAEDVANVQLFIRNQQ